MTSDPQQPSTEQIDRLQAGDPSVVAEILPLVYDQLKNRARHLMAQQHNAHTLQPTALVHEAWARLAAANGVQVDSRGAFLALAAKAMRSVLVDHARARNARKRGDGAQRVDLSMSGFGSSEEESQVVHLHESIERLSELEPELGRVAELRCFGGLSHQEISDATGVPLRTVERNWRAVRAWLQKELE